jgi:hypothetical protein
MQLNQLTAISVMQVYLELDSLEQLIKEDKWLMMWLLN